jgi:hypothetical protein
VRSARATWKRKRKRMWLVADLYLGATLHACGFALVSRNGTLYALRGRARWRVTDLATAATGITPHLWAQA